MNADNRPSPTWPRWVVASLVGLAFVAAAAYFSNRGPSRRYRETVRSFYAGVAALDVGDKDRALERLTEATQLSPQEPAAWANLALAQMQLGQFEVARENLLRAESLAPESASIQVLWSALENGLGRPEDAMQRLERAVELAPGDPKARFALVELLLRENETANRGRVTELIDQLLTEYPDNLLLLLQRLELTMLDDDKSKANSLLAALQSRSMHWPDRVITQLESLQSAMQSDPWLPTSLREMRFLRNVLKQTADFRAAVNEMVTPVKKVSQPIYHFLRLPRPDFSPAKPDRGLQFDVDNSLVAGKNVSVVVAAFLAKDGPPVAVWANSEQVSKFGNETIFTSTPNSSTAKPLSANGLVFADWDRDYRQDLIIAGPKGLKLLTASESGGFEDVTKECGLDAELISAAYYGAWIFDAESDGDLDLLLGPESAPARVLRNNGDGTFEPLPLFSAVVSPRDFCWADLDNDGDPDVAILDEQERLHLFSNRRSGRFIPFPTPTDLPQLAAIAVGDVNADGRLDLIASDANRVLQRLTWNSGEWDVVAIALNAKDTNPEPTRLAPSSTRLWLVDVDNSGTLDAVLGEADRTHIWLNRDGEQFETLPFSPFVEVVTDVEDVTGDGRLDLLGRNAVGQAQVWVNSGTLDYHFQFIRPRALQKAESSDSRMNSFALGTEIQIRSGLLVQTRVVDRPRVHFGLGTQLQTDVARLVWPHGAPQGEFELASDAEIIAEQRLTGSCPFLFAFNGQEMQFVTDFLWRSPLGMRINAQETAGVVQTEDWVKLAGDRLVPRNGTYDVRITADLWETHFFDHVSLLVVDHPEDREVFVDERFCFPPPPLRVVATDRPRPIQRVVDQEGRDVADVVFDRDRRYVDSFPLGQYQGVTSEHWVEIELDEEVPREGPVLLIAEGFVYPTDSSINVALAQGRHPRPHGVVLEIPDENGDWRPVSDDLGFPSGKDKTVLIDLQSVVGISGPRRFRLRTNMEIYWDRLRWAVEQPTTTLRTTRQPAVVAELRPRGISRMFQAGRKHPDLPEYDQPRPAAGHWRDLVGYYTRYGDVKELLASSEDRYVIMNAGDELQLEFTAPAPPAAGWTRDFVVIGDGWVKDGNPNTAFSRTVRPLPSHDIDDYNTPPTTLEQDPVYVRHADDWRKFHTRYVRPQTFARGLSVPSASRTIVPDSRMAVPESRMAVPEN